MSGSGDGSDEDVVNEDVLGFGLSRWGAGGDEKWLSGKVAQAYLRDRFRTHPCHPCRTRVGSTIGCSSLPEEYLNWVAWQVPEVLLGGHSSQEPALNDSRFASPSRRPWGWILYTP